jgi:hypothetical protein
LVLCKVFSKVEKLVKARGGLKKLVKAKLPTQARGCFKKIEMLFTLLSYVTTCPFTTAKANQQSECVPLTKI